MSLTAFNRTILELKHIFHDYVATAWEPFNRTILELKLSEVISISYQSALLIVPYWN